MKLKMIDLFNLKKISMGNKIVQLREYEYNQLQEKAELTDTKIRDLAEKYYQERGVFRIDIRVGLQDKYNGDTVFYTNVFSHENGLYKNDNLVPRGDRRIKYESKSKRHMRDSR